MDLGLGLMQSIKKMDNGSLLLQSIEPNTVLDIDPRLAECYDPDLDILNNMASFVGASDYNLIRAAKTNNTYRATLEGENGTSSAYWQMLSASTNPASEGNSYFKTPLSGASLPPVLRDLHKTQEGQATLIWEHNIVSPHKTAFASNNGASMGTAGFWIDITASSPYNFTFQARTSANIVTFGGAAISIGVSVYDQNNVTIVSIDKTATQYALRVWLNGVNVVDQDYLNYAASGTEDPAGAFKFWYDNDTQRNAPPVGSTVTAKGVINDFINDARAVAITNLIQARGS